MKERLPVGFMFKQINNIYEKEFNNLLRGIGITSSQCAVLDYLLGSSKEFMNQKDIEKALSLKNPTVTGILKGWMKRDSFWRFQVIRIKDARTYTRQKKHTISRKKWITTGRRSTGGLRSE